MRKLEKERSPQDLQVGGGRGGRGRGMTEQGKSFDAGEAPQKNRRSAAKNWVALYVGGYVET